MSCIYIECDEGDNLIALLHKKLDNIQHDNKQYNITYINKNKATIILNNQEVYDQLLDNNTAFHKLFALDWTNDAYDNELTFIIKRMNKL